MIIKRHPSLLPFKLPNASLMTYILGTSVLAITLLSLIFLQTRFTVKPNGHFFKEPVEVTVSVSNPLKKGAIRYTLDGSPPKAFDRPYVVPIRVKETSILQLATFDKNDNQTSDIYTYPIFIGSEHELPVVSIVTEERNLFDPETGIYVKYKESGEEWERPARLSFFEPDGRLGFQKDVGIRIHGGGSRTYPQKSFRVYAGYQKHSDQIKYPIFPELSYDTFNTFLIRASGNDWEYSFMRDEVMHQLAQDMTELDSQAIRPAVLYINNRYWGLYFLRERIDQHYLANKYGLSKDKLSITQIPHDVGPNKGHVIHDFGSKKAVEEFNELYDSSFKDCTGCAGYDSFSPSFDMDNMRDYLLLQIYSGNFDWPFGNVRLWRYEQPTKASEEEKSPIDGRFRWIFFDLDTTFAFTKETEEEVISGAQNNAFNRIEDPRFPLRNVILSKKFKDSFVLRATELLNTTLSEEYVTKIIDDRAASMRPEIPREIERWKNEKREEDNQIFQSIEEWEKNIGLLKVYAKYRTPDLFNDIVEFYDLAGTTEITLTVSPPEAGGVTIGPITKQASEMPWTGTFFKDTIMRVQSHPNKGYIFDHWEGDIPSGNKYNDSATLVIKNQKNIKAVFRERKWHEYIYNEVEN